MTSYEAAFKAHIDAQTALYNRLALLAGVPLRKLPE